MKIDRILREKKIQIAIKLSKTPSFVWKDENSKSKKGNSQVKKHTRTCEQGQYLSCPTFPMRGLGLKFKL
jgi:hypothetical protein